MKYNNVEEMIKTKQSYKTEKERFEIAIKNAVGNRKQVRGELKTYWTEVIENYKKIVKDLDENIKKLSQEIIKLSTFPNEILMPFLVECINLHEDESFLYSGVMLSYNFNCAEQVLPVYVNYNLIFPENLKEKEETLEKTFLISKMPFAYKDLFESFGVKYLMMPNDYETALICNDSLNPYFKEFPYLKRIAFDLVNRRLFEPEKSLTNILNEKLEIEKLIAQDLKELDGPKKELKQ